MEIATDSGTYQAAAGMIAIPLGKLRQANVDITGIVLTAYAITSAYSAKEVCITMSGLPVVLSEAYTVTSPTAIPSIDFHSYAASAFFHFLGFSTCSGGAEMAFPVVGHVNSISITPAPSASLPVGANSTTSPTLHSSNAIKPTVTPRLDEPTKKGIGVAVSFAALILTFLVAFMWRKRRLRSAAIIAELQGDNEHKQEDTLASEGDNQPYLQQKPELEAEERQRHELEARPKTSELDGETGINEIPAGTHEHRLAVMRSRQELEGGEHSQELDT